MKKFLLLFILLIPISASALSVTGLEISAPSELKQWEMSEITIDLKFSRTNSDGTLIGLGGGVEIEYNKEAITVEGVKAENSEVYTQGGQGYRDLVGILDFEENDIIFDTNCSNNVYCNNYRFVLQIYPKASGSINFTARLPYMLVYDISKLPNITEDDIEYVDGSFEKVITLNVKGAPKPVEATEPVEITERVTTAITAPPVAKITSSKSKSTTTKVPSSLTSNQTEAATPTTPTTTKERKEEKDKEKNNLLYFKNKKVYFYGAIVIGIILLLIIIKIIIIKIKDRKINKVLKGL